MTKVAKSALIKHDAYVQAEAECKNLYIAKFQAAIISQLSDSDENEDETATKDP